MLILLVLLCLAAIVLFNTTTDIFGRARINGKDYLLFLNGSTDGTETEIKIYKADGSTKSIGEEHEGETLEELDLQCSDGSILTTAILYDEAGGKVSSWAGPERDNDDVNNLELEDMGIRLEKGSVLKTNCAD